MFKDESNKRIAQSIKELMKKEGRGFLFSPVPQLNGKHKTMLTFVANIGEGEPPVEEQVFATMLAIMTNIRRNVPEDDYKKWKAAYRAYLDNELSLWNMKIELIN